MKVQSKERIKRRKAGCMKKIGVGFLLMAAAFFSLGGYEGEQERVETTYVVKSGDTLWDIGETYLEKNTGGRRYILEFIEGIREINPELAKRGSDIYPGQVLRISCFVKKQ